VSFLIDGLREALARIGALDRELFEALFTTLRVSVLSTALASAVALPVGFLVARRKFRGKRIVLALLKTALAFPTVVVALCVTGSSPTGALGALTMFSPAIVLGQAALITPPSPRSYGVLQAEVMAAYENRSLARRAHARSARRLEAGWDYHRDRDRIRPRGFEVGISLILGGNIRVTSRTMTTAPRSRAARQLPEAAALGPC
jgi:tungstate transport system permease protein